MIKCAIMTAPGFTLFDTPIGRCGVAWGDHGLTGVQLPQPNEAQTRTRLLQRAHAELPEAPPPPAVAQAIAGMTALLEGERADLGDIALDMSRVPEFNRGVYAIAREIPPGKTLTYGDIAKASRRRRAVARRRPGAGAEPVSDRRAVPSRAGRRRQAGRLLRQRRRQDQAEDAGDRGRRT